jgi:hypothetical protein
MVQHMVKSDAHVHRQVIHHYEQQPTNTGQLDIADHLICA